MWLREMTKFFRERTSIISSLMTPVLWLFVFGGGMGINLRTGTFGPGYSAFIFPGIIGMTLLFTSMRSGISIIWDRDFGFLKEILVAPISRFSIVLGKATGGATTAILQGLIILMLSFGGDITYILADNSINSSDVSDFAGLPWIWTRICFPYGEF